MMWPSWFEELEISCVLGVCLVRDNIPVELPHAVSLYTDAWGEPEHGDDVFGLVLTDVLRASLLSAAEMPREINGGRDLQNVCD